MSIKTVLGILLVFALVWIVLTLVLTSGNVWGATYFKFTYPSADGVSGRFVITDEANGDSIAGGVLTETERAALTYWKGSANLDPGGYTVEGFIFETSDTSIGSYRVDVYLTDNDSMIIDMSSLSERPAIGDTIQREASLATELAKALDSLADILDSLETQSTWIAQQAEVINIDGWNPATDQVTADVTAISGDGPATDNLEAMLDGTRAKLWLTQLNIVASGNDTAILAKGAGEGMGMLAFGGATGHGVQFRGGITSGDAISTWTNNGHGMSLYGSKEKHGLFSQAGDSGCGIYAMSGDDTCASANSYGMYIRGRVYDALQITAGEYTNAHGIEVRGGTDEFGDAVRIVASATNADGIDISAADGRGVYIDATGGNAVELRGDTGIFVLGDDNDIVGNFVDLDMIAAYMGACDSCYQRLYPEGGTANKDSVIIIDPSLGADSLVAKIVFIHGVTPSVYDTSYFYIAPWW